MGLDIEPLEPSAPCAALVSRGLLDIWDADRAVTSWHSFQRLSEQLERRPGPSAHRPQWLYRGEGGFSHDLCTSLEKVAQQHGIPLLSLYEGRIEQGIIRRFKREYSRHSIHVPPENDHISWLATMQHHGAPTRLLDITYSAYVALYFALWQCSAGRDAALWCFNADWLNDGWDQDAPDGYQEEYDRDTDGRYLSLYQIVLGHTRPKVYAINPYHLPERLILQQGGFLLPLDITRSFMDNVGSMPIDPVGRRGRRTFTARVLKIRLRFDQVEMEEARYRLLRMNVNEATLFPGLDGFALSLRDRIVFPEQCHGKRKGFEP
jgi:hypothetical protein